MLKLFLLVCVSVSLLVGTVSTSVTAQTLEATKQTEKIKMQTVALGDGARVSVRLHDKKKLTGYINYVGEEFFSMTVDKTKTSLKVPYSDVAQIERKSEKGGFPKAGKIALGIVGVLFVMGMIANGGE